MLQRHGAFLCHLFARYSNYAISPLLPLSITFSMWCLPSLSFTPHTSASLPFKDKYLNCHLCDIEHLTGRYTLSFCTFSMRVSGPRTSPTARWQGPAAVFMDVCLCVLARAHEICFYLTTVPIPADSAGIRSGFLCQHQPPSFIPPVFSFLLLSSGCSGWV